MRFAPACVVLVMLFGSWAGLADADLKAGRAAYERGDFTKARAHFESLAELGDRDALFWLGRLYESGKGVERDPVEAHKWFVLAWKRNVSAARRRALALRRQMPQKQFEESKIRIRAWIADFESRVRALPGTKTAGDTGTFYAKVYAATQSPPENSSLKTLCSARVDGTVVTFVTHDRERILIVAFTARPLLDASKDISLRPVTLHAKPRRPPRPSATMDWAYVYDRNEDGRVDYLAFLDGPSPIIPNPKPKNFSQLAPPAKAEKANGTTEFSIHLNLEQLLYALRHTKQVFWHLGDDNFDGTVDGYAVPTRDARTAWIDGHMIVRSTEFDGEFNRCVFAPSSRGTSPAACRKSGASYVVQGKVLSGIHVVPTGEELPLLSLINQAVRKCGLTSRHFRPK